MLIVVGYNCLLNIFDRFRKNRNGCMVVGSLLSPPFKGGYLEFSHHTKLKNGHITEINMKKSTTRQ